LRERHAEEYGLCVYCFVPDTYNGRVGEWMPAVYPCDTIKVLDAAEELKSSDLKTKVECDHPEGGLVPNGGDEFSMIEFTYCPKCGEEL
jgi:hypothetical protein